MKLQASQFLHCFTNSWPVLFNIYFYLLRRGLFWSKLQALFNFIYKYLNIYLEIQGLIKKNNHNIMILPKAIAVPYCH